ncbi:MAG: SIMPL domain-containing protein, partial [Hyphomonadaceae bacterium]
DALPILGALAAAAPRAEAQTQPTQQTGHMMMFDGTLLTVSAEGKAEGAPDIANVNLGVTTEGQTAQAAVQANAERMTQLVAALRRAGVAERDVQTANVSVNPQYVYGEGVPPRITGYQAANTVNVRVRNLGNLGRIIDSSVTAGGTNVNGVSFELEDPEPRLNDARRQAMQRARERANLYAEAAGLRVERIVSISEGYNVTPPWPQPVMMRMEAQDARAANTPIQPGEVRTTANVTVVFELR